MMSNEQREKIDAINAQVDAMLARGPLVIDKIDPVKLEQHKRLVAEQRRVGRVEVTVIDEAAEISQQAWDKLEMMRGVIDRDVVSKALNLAPPEPEKPRKLHEEYTLDDWRRGIANSSRQYHGT